MELLPVQNFSQAFLQLGRVEAVRSCKAGLDRFFHLPGQAQFLGLQELTLLQRRVHLKLVDLVPKVADLLVLNKNHTLLEEPVLHFSELLLRVFVFDFEAFKF